MGAGVLLFAGIIYAWSLLNEPFRNVLDKGQLGFNYTLTICFFCLGGVCSGFISKKTTPLLRLLISAALLFAGFFIASRLVGVENLNPLWLYLSYGVLCGTGIGFAYNTVISMTNAWFPDKMGLSSGVLLAGFGLSLMTVGYVYQMLGRNDEIGWSAAYLIIAISLGAILLLAAFFVKPPPQGTEFPAAGKGKKPQEQGEAKDYTTLEMVKRFSFAKLFIIMVVLSATGVAVSGFASDILRDLSGLDFGAGELSGDAARFNNFIPFAVGLFGVFNGLGRITVGWLYDNLGTRKTQYAVSITAVIAPLTLVFAIIASSVVLGIAGLCLGGFAFGLAPTTGSVFAAKFYGARNFPLNFSVINLVLIPAAFAPALAGMLRESTNDFLTVFIIITAISAVGAVINLTMKKA